MSRLPSRTKYETYSIVSSTASSSIPRKRPLDVDLQQLRDAKRVSQTSGLWANRVDSSNRAEDASKRRRHSEQAPSLLDQDFDKSPRMSEGRYAKHLRESREYIGQGSTMFCQGVLSTVMPDEEDDDTKACYNHNLCATNPPPKAGSTNKPSQKEHSYSQYLKANITEQQEHHTSITIAKEPAESRFVPPPPPPPPPPVTRDLIRDPSILTDEQTTVMTDEHTTEKTLSDKGSDRTASVPESSHRSTEAQTGVKARVDDKYWGISTEYTGPYLQKSTTFKTASTTRDEDHPSINPADSMQTISTKDSNEDCAPRSSVSILKKRTSLRRSVDPDRSRRRDPEETSIKHSKVSFDGNLKLRPSIDPNDQVLKDILMPDDDDDTTAVTTKPDESLYASDTDDLKSELDTILMPVDDDTVSVPHSQPPLLSKSSSESLTDRLKALQKTSRSIIEQLKKTREGGVDVPRKTNTASSRSSIRTTAPRSASPGLIRKHNSSSSDISLPKTQSGGVSVASSRVSLEKGRKQLERKREHATTDHRDATNKTDSSCSSLVQSPPMENKTFGLIEGFTVWCSYGFARPIKSGLSWRPPSKMYDSTYATVEQANRRAQYLFHNLNPFGIENLKGDDCLDFGQTAKKRCQAWDCTRDAQGKTWKVAVVPSHVFEWLDDADVNRHSFDTKQR